MNSMASGLPDRQAFPPVLGIGELSALLKKSPATILADRSRAPHLLPPDCTPQGSRQPLWLLADVLAWLGQFRRPVMSSQGPHLVSVARRGAPTKRERLLARQAGINVSEWRAQQLVQLQPKCLGLGGELFVGEA